MDASAKIGERRLSMSLWRDVKNNNNYGASISIGGQVPGGSAIGGYTGSLTWTNGQGFGNSFNYTFSNQFVKDAADGWDDFTNAMGNEMDDILIGLGWKMGRKEGSSVTKPHLMRESRIQDPIYNLAKERWRQKVLKEINDSWLTNGNEQVSPETLNSLLSESDKEEFILGVINEKFGDQGVSAYISGNNQALKDSTRFVLMDFVKMFIGYGSKIDPTKPKGFDPIDNKKNEITNESLRDQEWLYAYGYNHSIDGYYKTGTLLSMAVPSNFIKLTKEFEVAQKYGKVISEVFDLNLAEKTNRKLFNALRGGRPDEVIRLINNMKLDSIPNSAEMIRIAEFATKAKREINIIFDETTKTSRLIVGDADRILFDPKSNIKILAHIHPGGNPLPSKQDFLAYKELLKSNPYAGKFNVYTYYGKYEYSLGDLNTLDKLGWIKYAD